MAVLNTPVKIDDLPPEIIEKFAPSDSPETISSLKLVNKRFNEIFTQDKFYKPYLFYEERYFLSDLMSNSTAVGVKEAIDEIKSGAVGKWKGYLKLQKAHLANWRRGRIDNYVQFAIPDLIPDNSFYRSNEVVFYELYDEDGFHWFLIRQEKQVTLCNITSGVQYISKSVESFSATIVPGQVVLGLGLDNGLFAVYSFSNDDSNGLSFEFQFKFLFDKTYIFTEENLPIEAGASYYKFCLNFVFISGKEPGATQIKNIFLGTSWDGFIHVWDLKSQFKIRQVSIHDHKVWHDYVEANEINGFHLIPGEFPNVILQLNCLKRETQVSVYDVVRDQVTHVIDNLFYGIFGYDFLMNSNLFCLHYYVVSEGIWFNIYEFSAVDPKATEPKHPKLIESFNVPSFHTLNVFGKWKKTIFKRCRDIEIVTVNDNGVQKRHISNENHLRYLLLGYLPPDLLLLCRVTDAFQVLKVISTSTGDTLFTIAEEEGVKLNFWDTTYYKGLHYPSKMIVRVNDEFRI